MASIYAEESEEFTLVSPRHQHQQRQQQEEQQHPRKAWSSSSSSSCSDGHHHQAGAAPPKCVCAPATHARSFKCRLHRVNSQGHSAPSAPPPAAAHAAPSTRTVEAQ